MQLVHEFGIAKKQDFFTNHISEAKERSDGAVTPCYDLADSPVIRSVTENRCGKQITKNASPCHH